MSKYNNIILLAGSSTYAGWSFGSRWLPESMGGNIRCIGATISTWRSMGSSFPDELFYLYQAPATRPLTLMHQFLCLLLHFVCYVQPHFLSKCHGSILHILVHNHQKSAASSFPGNMRSGCINPKPVIAWKGVRRDDLNMGNRVAVFTFVMK